MKSSRRKGLCIAVVIMLLLPLIYGALLVVHTVNFHINQYNAAFWRYREEFVLVKDFIWEQFPERMTQKYQSSDAYPFLYVSRDESGGRRLYDPNTKEYLQIPGEVTQALERICKDGFPAYLDLIRFKEGQIHFCGSSDQGWYALIYSPNGRPKTFGPHAPEEVCIRWIGGGWYHATRLEDWMVISKWF